MDVRFFVALAAMGCSGEVRSVGRGDAAAMPTGGTMAAGTSGAVAESGGSVGAGGGGGPMRTGAGGILFGAGGAPAETGGAVGDARVPAPEASIATGGTGGSDVGNHDGGAVIPDATPEACESGPAPEAGKPPADATACVCSSGACCDGCQFKKYGALCGDEWITDRCDFVTRYPGTTRPDDGHCQQFPNSASGGRYHMFCSGSSRLCDGHVFKYESTSILCGIQDRCSTADPGLPCIPCPSP